MFCWALHWPVFHFGRTKVRGPSLFPTWDEAHVQWKLKLFVRSSLKGGQLFAHPPMKLRNTFMLRKYFKKAASRKSDMSHWYTFSSGLSASNFYFLISNCYCNLSNVLYHPATSMQFNIFIISHRGVLCILNFGSMIVNRIFHMDRNIQYLTIEYDDPRSSPSPW